MAGGAKTSFVIGGQGTKPDKNFKNVSCRRFTRHGRIMKPKGGLDLNTYLRKVYNYPI